MTPTTPTEVVDAFIACIEAKDIDGAMALVAEEISYENMPMQPITTRDAVRQTLEGFLGVASQVEWPVSWQIEQGDRVVNERLDRFLIGDGWLELPIAGIFEVRDGLITLWRDYFDMNTYTTRLAELSS